MGRSPCCDKVGLKKGPWTPDEDQKLLAFIQEHGHGSWRALPSKAGLQRCGKSCRLRWINYLRPDIKRGKFSLQEEQTIIQLHALLGNRWSAIATHLSKRTDNEIKNYWNTHLKKRLAKTGIDPVSHKPKSSTLLFNDDQLKSMANLSHMAQWESARLEAEARLVNQSKLRSISLLPNQVNSTMCSLAYASKPCSRYLDICKAWNEILGNTPIEGTNGNAKADIDSLRSTFSSTTNNSFKLVVSIENSLVCHNDETAREERKEEWDNDLITSTTDNTCTIEPLKSSNNNDELVTTGNLLESFTDILLCSSNYNDHSVRSDYSSNTGLTYNNDNSCPSKSIRDCYEDKNKIYLDNFLGEFSI